MLILLALVAAIVIGAVCLLVLGQPIAIFVAVVILVAGVVAQRSSGGVRRGIGSTLLLGTLVVGAYAGVVAIDLLDALQTTDGPVDPADQVALDQAEDKLSGVGETSSFRVELSEPELQAVAQEGLASAGDVPVRRIEVDLRGATQDIEFVATFKSDEQLQARGVAAVTVGGGEVDVALSELDFGRVHVPRLASGAVEQLLGAVTDLNEALAQERAAVQSIQITDDSLVVIGTRATPEVLTNTDLLDAITAQAGAAINVEPPAEVVGRGVEGSLDAPGDPFILAIGDSLAANVGVDDSRDGYVSRVHGALQRRDGATYGLRNLGVPGETSGTLLSGGQLDAAEQELAGRSAAYVLIDIGANDLLGHLASQECAADLASGSCQARIEQTLTIYRTNVGQMLDRVTAAAGDARVVFLQSYNPFSLGLGESDQERESSAILSRLNQVAAEEAAMRDVIVADGFTPMQQTTAATTHMLDAQPDIHPNAIGYDVLAAAIMSRLG